MFRTNEQLLLAYKKANKEARKKIIAKSIYGTEAEYLASLMEPDATAGSPAAAALFKHNKKEEETSKLDQVIAFDTTGSMRSYIHAVKTHVNELIPKLFSENPDLRLKIVAFGDYCDMINERTFGNAYQESALTNDQKVVISFVNSAKDTSGGDGDEFYELVIKKITEETPWREDAKKAVLLIADCGPHPVGYSCPYKVTNARIDWREEANKSAKLGIQWDTLNCGASYQASFYRPLSEITNGVNIPFQSSGKTQEAVYAATSVRGSLKSKKAFEASFLAAMDKGDDELIGTYKSLSKKL